MNVNEGEQAIKIKYTMYLFQHSSCSYISNAQTILMNQCQDTVFQINTFVSMILITQIQDTHFLKISWRFYKVLHTIQNAHTFINICHFFLLNLLLPSRIYFISQIHILKNCQLIVSKKQCVSFCKITFTSRMVC